MLHVCYQDLTKKIPHVENALYFSVALHNAIETKIMPKADRSVVTFDNDWLLRQLSLIHAKNDP